MIDLRTSQARIIAAADGERRRLERDLHDGAQQRLVAVALNLRVARERLNRGEDALELVSQAGDEAQRAIGELRDLARGIHPAVLTDRGLGPALRDVAGRSPLPVDVLDVRRTSGFPPTIEATAYFVVSEALTNVAKYARGERGRRSSVRCDGRRGWWSRSPTTAAAAPIRRRQRAARAGGPDRRARRHARPSTARSGGGTRVRAELAIVDRREEERGVVLDERAAAILRLRRRRGLVTHAAVFGVFQLAMIVIWAATGFGNFWPGWTIFCGASARPARLAGDPAPADHRLRGVPRYITLSGGRRLSDCSSSSAVRAIWRATCWRCSMLGWSSAASAAASVRISQSGVRSGSSTWPTGGQAQERASCSPRTCDMLLLVIDRFGQN